MIIKNSSKTVKFVCPNNCGSIRMLNLGVTLALCQNPKCNLAMMIPADIPRLKLKKTNIKQPQNQPFACDKCKRGREDGIHVLTIKNKQTLCYDCGNPS